MADVIMPPEGEALCYQLPNGIILQIYHFDHATGCILFFDANWTAVEVPQGLTVTCELGGPTRHRNGRFYVSRLDNITISFKKEVILILKNQWHVTSPSQLIRQV